MCQPKKLLTAAMNAEAPVEYFQLFFDNELANPITTEANRNALQQNENFTITREDYSYFWKFCCFQDMKTISTKEFIGKVKNTYQKRFKIVSDEEI